MEAKAFISKLLEVDPKKRYSAVEALKDLWILKYNQKEEVNNEEVLTTMSHLKEFRAISAMQKAVLTYISTYAISKEEEKKRREIFDMLDSNHDGQLSSIEILEGFKKIYGGNEDDLKIGVETLMKQVDINKNGMIDYNEFLIANINKADCLNQENLKNAFDFFDEVSL